MSTFKPTYLYIKQHSVTGKLYFGKTTKNPEKYMGSGSHWSNHIKKHGKQYVDTLWYCLFYTQSECTEFALMFSQQENIVKSTDWLNQMLENGIDGAGSPGRIISDETKEKHRQNNLGNVPTQKARENMSKAAIKRLEKFGPYIPTQEVKDKISNTIISTGSSKGENNGMFGKRGEESPNFGQTRTDQFKQEQSQRMSGENNGMFGKHHTPERNQYMSEKLTGYKHKSVTCPHCNKTGGETGMKKWHFDKCKFKTIPLL